MEMPNGLRLARTTSEFDELTVPVALLATHRVAVGAWGRLRVRAGTVRLVFENSGEGQDLVAGDHGDIPPDVPHHVELGPGARFVVEFHRP